MKTLDSPDLEVVGAYYSKAVASCGPCSHCGSTHAESLYEVRDKSDETNSRFLICEVCLQKLPVEKQRVALFEWILKAPVEETWSAAQLGTYHACKPWASPLFMPGLIASGENVEVFPPVACAGPVIRPKRRCDDPAQQAPRGLMRRVFWDFRHGVVGNIGAGGLDRLKSMNEPTIWDRNFVGSECKPDIEMVKLLKTQIISYSNIATK